MDEIIWLPIDSTNGLYEASNKGDIRNSKTKHILKPQLTLHGYYQVSVRDKPCNSKPARIHRLVTEAFFGKCPDGYVVNHKDGNKKNNNIDNLEYVTPSENNQHALDTGLRHPADASKYIKHGEENSLAKITEKQAIEIIKEHYITGEGCRKLAKKFNVSLGIVSGLLSKTRPRWTHLDREKIFKEAMIEKERRNNYE